MEGNHPAHYLKNTSSGEINMDIENEMIGIITNFTNPHSEFVLYSYDPKNHIGLRVGDKYTFYYREGLADFNGTLVKFVINYDPHATEIYFEANCCETGKTRRVSIKDLEKIKCYYDEE